MKVCKVEMTDLKFVLLNSLCTPEIYQNERGALESPKNGGQGVRQRSTHLSDFENVDW